MKSILFIVSIEYWLREVQISGFMDGSYCCQHDENLGDKEINRYIELILELEY